MTQASQIQQSSQLLSKSGLERLVTNGSFAPPGDLSLVADVGAARPAHDTRGSSGRRHRAPPKVMPSRLENQVPRPGRAQLERRTRPHQLPVEGASHPAPVLRGLVRPEHGGPMLYARVLDEPRRDLGETQAKIGSVG